MDFYNVFCDDVMLTIEDPDIQQTLFNKVKENISFRKFVDTYYLQGRQIPFVDFLGLLLNTFVDINYEFEKLYSINKEVITSSKNKEISKKNEK